MPESIGTSLRERRRAELALECETTAIRLFAERGFRQVTVADVAAECGVTSRTLFRYFPTKEDMLLSPPRRATRLLLDEIAALPRSEDPIAAVWEVLVDMTVRYGASFEALDYWYQAAADVPEVVSRMRGERASIIEERLTQVFADWMQLDPATDVRPGVLAAAVQASERAVMNFYRASEGRYDLAELFRIAFDGLRNLAETLR